MLAGHRHAVGVVRRHDDAHFCGLQTCGSIWVCPLCSEKVLAKRADELREAVESWIKAGGRVALITLTMRHRRGHRLAELWDALSDAWSSATRRNKKIVRELDRAGVAHWVRRVEATIGPNGWHLHVHALVFLPGDATDKTVRRLGRAMFTAWKRMLVHRGFPAPLRDSGGLDAKLLDFKAETAGDAAGYLAKGAFTESALSAARELASGHGKYAGAENRTIMQLLADLAEHGHPRDRALWREWESASKGRQAITWSARARAELLAEPTERTDEELAEDEDRGELVAFIPREAWSLVLDLRLAPKILELVESVPAERGYYALELLFAAHGLPAPLHPP